MTKFLKLIKWNLMWIWEVFFSKDAPKESARYYVKTYTDREGYIKHQEMLDYLNKMYSTGVFREPPVSDVEVHTFYTEHPLLKDVSDARDKWLNFLKEKQNARSQ